jgi:hypothetical protein
MRIGYLLLGAWALPFLPLGAQEEQLALDPPLRQCFPLEAISGGGVHVKVPVLLNEHLVLRPDAVLRFIYLDANAPGRARSDEADSDSGKPSEGDGSQKRGEGGGPYGGWGGQQGNEYAGYFDDLRREDARGTKSEMKSEVWTQKELFLDALDHASEFGTTFVYNLPITARTLTATMDLPEGMLLAEESGHVRVLALQDNSHPFAAGVRPGDTIVAFDTAPPIATLQDFIREYLSTKQKAKSSGRSTYALQIIRSDNGQPVTVQVAAPPTLPSLF